MSLDVGEYSFYGKVNPERANVNISRLEYSFDTDDFDGKFIIKIGASQITATVQVNRFEHNLRSLRNSLVRYITDITDIFSYGLGYSYGIEITSCILPSKDAVTFGVEHPAIRRKIDDDEFDDLFNNIHDHIHTEHGIYLRLCLADFRRALSMPADTGFLCYRSIESIRQYFARIHNLDPVDDRGPTWVKLRDELTVSRSKIDGVKDFADARRHGDIQPLSGPERDQILEDTHDIISEFVEYLDS